MPAPDEMALWPLLRKRVTTDIIACISSADWGNNEPQHFRAIQAILNEGRVATIEEFVKDTWLKECCELVSGGVSKIENAETMLAIWILGRACAHYEIESCGFPSRAITIAMGSLNESREFQHASAAFLAWLHECKTFSCPDSFLAFGALCIMAHADPNIAHIESNIRFVDRWVHADAAHWGWCNQDVPENEIVEWQDQGEWPWILGIDNFRDELAQLLARKTLVPVAGQSPLIESRVRSLWWPGSTPTYVFRNT